MRAARTSIVSCIAIAAAAIAATNSGALALSQSLPTVSVDYPNGSFYHQCKTIAERRQCYGPSPLRVRPKAITLSEDGNGYLSRLIWSGWNNTAAAGSGLELVRCFGGSTDPNCRGSRFGYTVPVTVRLGRPVSTSRGVVFTVLTIRRTGSLPSVFCLPPASAC